MGWGCKASSASIKRPNSICKGRSSAGSGKLDNADWESETDAERTVVIREVSHSQFLAAEDELATTQAMPNL